MKKIVFYKEANFPTGSESHIINKINDAKGKHERVILCGKLIESETVSGYLKKIKDIRIQSYQVSRPDISGPKLSLYQALKTKHFPDSPWKLHFFYPLVAIKLILKTLFQADRKARNFVLFHGHNLPFKNLLFVLLMKLQQLKFFLVRLLKPSNSQTYFFYKSLKQERPCIVDCCYGWDLLPLIPMKRELGFKLVVSIRGKDLGLMENVRPFADYARQFGDLFLVRCEDMKRRLTDMGFTQDKVLVNHSGCDVDLFQFNPRSTLKSVLQIASVGRLVPKKGHGVLLEAGKILRDRNVPFQMHIFGDGPLEKELKDFVAANELQQNIQFHGYVKNEEVIRHFDQTDIFIHPAIKAGKFQDAEGIPVALMEAMASGILCISTYHSGIPELITSGETGFLVEEGNAEGIADLVVKISRQTEEMERSRILKNARLHVEAEFNSRLQGTQYLEFVTLA